MCPVAAPAGDGLICKESFRFETTDKAPAIQAAVRGGGADKPQVQRSEDNPGLGEGRLW